jgi:hypothetical protein
MTIFQIVNPVISGIANKKPGEAGGVLAKFLSAGIGLMLIIGTIYSFIQVLQGAIMWLSSGGDKTNLEKAQHQIFDSIIGLFVMFICWVLFIVIMRFLGIGIVGTTGEGFQLKLPSLL